MKMIYLDSSIYLNVIRGPKEKEFFRGSEMLLSKVEGGNFSAATSVLAIHEIKWALYKKGEELIAEEAIPYIESIPHHDILPISLDMAKLATNLRIDYQLKSHDSFHLAAALLTECKYFITRDEKLKKIRDIEILAPEEFLRIKI